MIMNNINSIILEGDIVKDALLKRINETSSVCCFTIAINSYHKKDGETIQETSYIDIEFWHKNINERYVDYKKGKKVRVFGKLKQKRWIDTYGNNKQQIVIVADNVETCRK